MVELFHHLSRLAVTAAAAAGSQTQASVTLRRRGACAVVAQSGTEAGQVTRAAVVHGDGACSAALDGRVAVAVPDLAVLRGTWPAWVEDAMDVGFRSALAVPATVDEADDDVAVALTLYSPRRGPWSAAEQLSASDWVDACARTVADFLAGGTGRPSAPVLVGAAASARAMDRGLEAVMAESGADAREALDTLVRALGARTVELVDVTSSTGRPARGRGEDRRAGAPHSAAHPLRRPASG